MAKYILIRQFIIKKSVVLPIRILFLFCCSQISSFEGIIVEKKTGSIVIDFSDEVKKGKKVINT